MLRQSSALLAHLRAIHARIRDQVVLATEAQSLETLALAVGDEAGDTIFAIDRLSEELLVEAFADLAREWPLLLIGEGLPNGRLTLPHGTLESQAELCVIVDPIDGTRGLMYQKRPGWILTGVALNHGPQVNLQNIELALMTEIPLVKQHLSDQWWALAGSGVSGQRFNRLTKEAIPLQPRPSQATTLEQGFASISRFFPGDRDRLAALDDALIERLLGPNPAGRAQCFEDQYICSGGQLAELLAGHDRFIADLRPLLAPLREKRGQPALISSHPYDLCTELIAREAGIIVCDPFGQPLAAPLDVETPVAWVGYANPALAAIIGPVLGDLLQAHGFLS